MEIEVLGSPKTVRLCVQMPDGRNLDAPMEIWIASIIALLPSKQKQELYALVDRAVQQHRLQSPVARVVADIPMPHLNKGN